MAYNLPPSWDPGFAMPSNVRDEGLERRAFVTKQMPRGTYDQPKVGTGGYVVPQYVRDEGYGQGTYTTKWQPGGTYSGPPVPHYLNKRPRVLADRRLRGGGRAVTIQTGNRPPALSGITSEPMPEPFENYGQRAATMVLHHIYRLPPKQRSPQLQKILNAIDPTLWPRMSQIARRNAAEGMPKPQALHQGLARAMSTGIAAEIIINGQKAQMPKPRSLLGLSCYGCGPVMSALGGTASSNGRGGRQSLGGWSDMITGTVATTGGTTTAAPAATTDSTKPVCLDKSTPAYCWVAEPTPSDPKAGHWARPRVSQPNAPCPCGPPGSSMTVVTHANEQQVAVDANGQPILDPTTGKLIILPADSLHYNPVAGVSEPGIMVGPFHFFSEEPVILEHPSQIPKDWIPWLKARYTDPQFNAGESYTPCILPAGGCFIDRTIAKDHPDYITTCQSAKEKCDHLCMPVDDGKWIDECAWMAALGLTCNVPVTTPTPTSWVPPSGDIAAAAQAAVTRSFQGPSYTQLCSPPLFPPFGPKDPNDITWHETFVPAARFKHPVTGKDWGLWINTLAADAKQNPGPANPNVMEMYIKEIPTEPWYDSVLDVLTWLPSKIAEAGGKVIDVIGETSIAATKELFKALSDLGCSTMAPAAGAAVSTYYGVGPQVGANGTKIAQQAGGCNQPPPPPPGTSTTDWILPVAIFGGAAVLALVLTKPRRGPKPTTARTSARTTARSP